MSLGHYTVLSALQVLQDRESVPEEEGVYTIRCHDPVLIGDLDANGVGAAIYVGRAGNLRRRLRLHVRGPSAGSTFRASLGLILAPSLGLSPQAADVGGGIWMDNEDLLSAWICANLSIAFATSDDADSDEGQLIQTLQPPLNIQKRHQRPSAQRLAQARAVLREAHRKTRLNVQPNRCADN